MASSRSGWVNWAIDREGLKQGRRMELFCALRGAILLASQNAISGVICRAADVMDVALGSKP